MIHSPFLENFHERARARIAATLKRGVDDIQARQELLDWYHWHGAAMNGDTHMETVWTEETETKPGYASQIEVLR